MDLAPDFDEFCALLTARAVEFVIVGAHALAFGAPRFTGDLGILVRPTEENGRRVLLAIADFGFPTASLTAADIVFVAPCPGSWYDWLAVPGLPD